ncbi:MAG: FliM/FliN family flagellar motor switch protein [Gammaproteobacteria bacterium]
MSSAAVPLLLLGDTRRHALARRVTQALEEWRRGWLPECTQSIRVDIEEVSARPVDIRSHEACCFRVASNGEWPFVLVVPRRSLAGLVGVPSHGADASSRFADEHSLAAFLEREALLRISSCLLPPLERGKARLERLPASAADVFRDYDAARFVCACVTLGDSRCVLDVLIAPAVVERLTPARPAAPDSERVERRRSAIGTQPVELDALLGYAEVSVSDLAALSVGDVIVLQQSLTDAGGIAVRGGERVTSAAPGRVDGKRAIQIRGRAA